MTKRTVLVVDDEPQIRTIVEHKLQNDGYTVLQAADGYEALEVFRQEQPELVIIDLMLPKLDGFELTRIVREESPVPIIILSAKGDDLDKAVGFRMGADDYITKPFSPSELALRVDAILKRLSRGGVQSARLDNGSETLDFGDLVIDRSRYVVTLKGKRVDLTAKEFDLLWFMASNPEYVFGREQLMEQVWKGKDQNGDPNRVTVLVSRLREKIEVDPAKPVRIKTVWGVGYKFEPETADVDALEAQ